MSQATGSKPEVGLQSDGENILSASAALGGAKGAELEAAKALGAVDVVDNKVDQHFAAQGRGDEDSPIAKVIWGDPASAVELLLLSPDFAMNPEALFAVEEISSKAKQLLHEGKLFGDNGKISEQAGAELAEAGYLKLLIPEEYGGFGLSIPAALKTLEQLATINPILGLFVSVHGMIGAVNPLRLYGSEEQKKRWLPQLAQTSSAFALTEPGAGSDVRNIKTRAVSDGEHWLITGHKMFITNAWYDRILSVVCVVTGADGKDSYRVVILRTPKEDTESFRINKYGIHALKKAYNVGLEFRNFRVPKEDMLEADGLEIAFNGLNAARIAVAVNSQVGVYEQLAAMLPWSQRRETFRKPIGQRPLVEARIGESFSNAVAIGVIWRYCSAVLQQGYRGEAECIIAKTFGSDAGWEVLANHYTRTVGGRMLLEGDVGGDSLHDISAERIYEGENSMLLMKLFGNCVKGPQKQFLEPMITKLQKRGITRLRMRNPLHLFWLALYGMPQGIDFILRATKYAVANVFGRPTLRKKLKRSGVSGENLKHAVWAVDKLQRMSLELTLAMFKHQTGLINKQNQMVEMATRIQLLFVMAVTAIHSSQQLDTQKIAAATLFCRETRRKLNAPKKSDNYYKVAQNLGSDLYQYGCPWTDHLDQEHVKVRGDYDNETHQLDTSSVTPGKY